MGMDCIPSGMELFPAADEDQFDFIKKVIDDCDYYVLVIGARYGSISSEGMSYTEKEYEYAVEKGMKVLAFLHKDPDSIAVNKSEVDPALRAKLSSFRGRVADGRLVKFWEKADDLPGLVAVSLGKVIKTYPALGWVRAEVLSSEDLKSDLINVRQENDKLKKRLEVYESNIAPKIDDLAGLDDIFTVNFNYSTVDGNEYDQTKLSWRQIFSALSPSLIRKIPEEAMVNNIGKMAFRSKSKGEVGVCYGNKYDVQTIGLQLVALGLIRIFSSDSPGGSRLYWEITHQGNQLMMQERTVRKVQSLLTSPK